MFQATLREMDMSPNMIEFVNIREHCAFVHQQERPKALKKAIQLITAGIARAHFLEHVPTKVVDVEQAALVIGGGIAGLSAAIDLSKEGFDVTLVEEKPTIGGRMAQLDRTFPTDDCSI
ncbi:MAG: FAD-dependent oxidoreductase [Promethearchaeota archaeon]